LIIFFSFIFYKKTLQIKTKMSVSEAFNNMLELIQRGHRTPNAKVRSGIKELKGLNIWNLLSVESGNLIKVNKDCFKLMSISILISTFNIWMFSESFFYDIDMRIIVSSYIISQASFYAALYGLVQYKTRNFRVRGEIIRKINSLITNLESIDFSAINDDNEEFTEKKTHLQDLVEEIDDNGRYVQSDIMVTTMSFEFFSIALTLSLIYLKCYSFLKNAPTNIIIGLFLLSVVISYMISFHWSSKGYDNLKMKDRRTKSELHRVMSWLENHMKTGSTGSTI